jgi:hypothetical protein
MINRDNLEANFTRTYDKLKRIFSKVREIGDFKDMSM